MTTPISSTSSTAVASSSSSASSSTLGQDAFLKLLIAQLSNQDPLQPMDGTQFVTQLAQFSAVEQATAQTQSLNAISAQLTGIAANDAVGLVGKHVTVQSTQFTSDGTDPSQANVSLAGAAASVTVSITDSAGNAVRTLNLGANPAGPLTITWDGRNNAGQSVPAGSYSFSAVAASSSSAPVAVSQNVTGLVAQVTFGQGYPAVVLSSGITAPVSQLISASQ